MCVLSHFSRVRLLVTLWTARQGPLSMEFSRQEYWSGLPFPTPGDLPHTGVKVRFPVLQAILYYWVTGLIWKDPDAGKDWRQEEKGTTEDEMVGWHHRLNGHEFGWTLGVDDGQGGLACCGSWGRTKLMLQQSRTQLSDWTELESQNPTT